MSMQQGDQKRVFGFRVLVALELASSIDVLDNVNATRTSLKVSNGSSLSVDKATLNLSGHLQIGSDGIVILKPGAVIQAMEVTGDLENHSRTFSPGNSVASGLGGD